MAATEEEEDPGAAGCGEGGGGSDPEAKVMSVNGQCGCHRARRGGSAAGAVPATTVAVKSRPLPMKFRPTWKRAAIKKSRPPKRGEFAWPVRRSWSSTDRTSICSACASRRPTAHEHRPYRGASSARRRARRRSISASPITKASWSTGSRRPAERRWHHHQRRRLFPHLGRRPRCVPRLRAADHRGPSLECSGARLPPPFLYKPAPRGVICGFGAQSYILALDEDPLTCSKVNWG